MAVDDAVLPGEKKALADEGQPRQNQRAICEVSQCHCGAQLAQLMLHKVKVALPRVVPGRRVLSQKTEKGTNENNQSYR